VAVARGRTLVLLALGLIAFATTEVAASADVTLAAVGDVLLARGVGRQISKHGDSYPLAKVAPILRSADLAFFNLECPLSNRGAPTHFKYLFRANPALAHSLRAGGLNVASLANNHSMDYGRDALMDTAQALRRAGISPVGAGATRARAIQPVVIVVRGLKVGFVAYTDVDNFGVSPRSDRPTSARVYESTLAKEVRAAKSKADVLIVSFHWGNEYWKRPDDRQRQLAKIAIDNGADLILGHHPHVLEPTATYHGKTVVYSMGGFVWDPIVPGAEKSAIYLFNLSKNKAKLVRTIPALVVQCRPITQKTAIR
jgi:poly-gamma-glutamate capsule biosynthesis protein CapA/YwtB (metallophosphatase superfamily)